MVIDVAPLLRGEAKKIDIDYMLTPEALDGIIFDNDAHVTGSLTDNAGYMRLKLRAEIGYRGECARCLAPINGVFSLDFERTVTTEGMLSEQQLEDMSDEYVLIEGNLLDVDLALSEELVLGFPSRLLCEEDCPGLCPKCGKPRREGNCGCPEKEPDPRLAILKTLFDNHNGEEK